jgi:hypothetical protein
MTPNVGYAVTGGIIPALWRPDFFELEDGFLRPPIAGRWPGRRSHPILDRLCGPGTEEPVMVNISLDRSRRAEYSSPKNVVMASGEFR